MPITEACKVPGECLGVCSCSRAREGGNVAFYLLFVLPVVIALLMIVVDVSAWQSLREEAQSEADRIALQVANSLPHKDGAITVFTHLANDFNARSISQGSSLQVQLSEIADDITSSKVRVRIQGQHASTLDFFLKSLTGQEVLLQVNEDAEARLVPQDAVLIISDAISLRPAAPLVPADFSPGDLGYASFGNAFEWPASEYFMLAPLPQLRPSPEPIAPLGWPQWWEHAVFARPEFQRWLTQSCFSPAITPLKLAAMMIAESVEGGSLNRLSVLATPGDVQGGAGYSVLKEISIDTAPYWSDFFESPTGICDEACVYYSSFSDRYAFPESSLAESDSCDELYAQSPLSVSSGHYPNPFTSNLSNCFLNREMSLREVIYYRAVRSFSHELANANVSRALKGAVSLLREEEKNSRNEYVVSRGNLSGAASRTVFLLLDALPALSESVMVEVLSALSSDSRLKIHVFAYAHEGLDSFQVSELGEKVAEYNNQEGISAFLVDESNIMGVIQSVLGSEKKVVLAS